MQQKITDLRDAMNKAFHERESAVDASLVALLASEHVVLLGPPGTGKSALARSLAGALGADYFEYLFTRFSTPEEFLGPFSLKGLENDEYKRKPDGYLPRTRVAFLDEIFKANSASLNTLLPLINERVMHNGGKVEKLPLEMVVAASNEMPQGEDLGALWDRFLLRVEVVPVQDRASRLALLEAAHLGAPIPAMPQLTEADLKAARAEAMGLPVGAKFFDAMLELRAKLEAEGIVRGDRRWQKCVKLAKAYAYVMGDTVVDADHFPILCDALWDVPDEATKVAQIVDTMVAPTLTEARATFDAVIAAIKPVIEEAQNAGRAEVRLSKMGEAMTQIRNAHKLLKKQRAGAVDGSRAATQIDSLISKLTKRHDEIRDDASRGINVSIDGATP